MTGCPDRKRPNAAARSTTSGMKCRSQNFSGNSSVRGRSRPPTISSPSPNARRMLRTQSGRGRQSASVLARWVAPCAMAWRMPVSEAAPVPFLVSAIIWTPCRRTISAVSSVLALSTTTSVKFWSSCSASALIVASMLPASL